MTWGKTLLISLTILVLCSGEESSCRIWSEHGAVVIYSEYVFCQCNGSAATSSDIQFGVKESSISSPIEFVDDFSVKIKGQFQGNELDPQLFYCVWNKDNKSSVAAEKIYRIIPQLKVSDFKCRSYPKEDVGNCTLIVYKYPYLEDSKYYVSANGLPKVTCVEFPKYNIECKNVHINQNITTNFKIEMEIMGIIQNREININLDQIVIPNWKFIKVKFEFESEENLNCRCVRVLSQYEGLDCQVESYMYKDWNQTLPTDYHHFPIAPDFYTCLSENLRGYKKLKPKVSCRFGEYGSPWSEEYIFNCTTDATRPSKPPQILPNGFFYESDEKKLYIFWFHLDEMDWNGPNFGYAAQSTDGKNATIVANTTALFRGWEASLPATIHVWSVNSVGHSEGSSSLRLDSLTNVNQQSRNLHYNDKEQVLRWNPPIDTNNLVGYTVYWCTASLNISQICDDKDDLRMQNLSLSQHQYPFPKSMNLSNMAVAVRYSDKIGGGMRWTGYKWNIGNKTGAGISYYLAPIGVSLLIAFCIYFYRRYRECSDIDVILCEGLMLERNKDLPTPRAPVVFSGSVSPQTVMNISRVVPLKTAAMEKESQEDDYVQMRDTFLATVSYSRVNI